MDTPSSLNDCDCKTKKSPPDLGHQRAYLRKQLKEVDALVQCLAGTKEEVTKVEREIYKTIKEALEYTEKLP